MLTSYEAVKAEQEYRRALLRDLYKKKMSVVSKGAAAVVLASVMIAGCGAVVTDGPSLVVEKQTNVVSDSGPSWEPNLALLDQYLGR